MVSIAINRVLSRSGGHQAVIGSLADLRRAYQDELAANGSEIETEADAFRAELREVLARTRARTLGQRLRCTVCDGPISDAKRLSRRYCSARCRQRARRTWLKDA